MLMLLFDIVWVLRCFSYVTDGTNELMQAIVVVVIATDVVSAVFDVDTLLQLIIRSYYFSYRAAKVFTFYPFPYQL